MADDASDAPPYRGMTSEELADVVEALRAKRIPPPCEMCGVDAWVIGQHLASPLMIKKDGPQVTPNYGLVQSSVVVLCSNCGNTKMFSTGPLGFALR